MPGTKLSRIPASWAVWFEFGRDPQPVGDVENDDDARRLTELLHRSLVEVTHQVSRTVKLAKPDAVTPLQKVSLRLALPAAAREPKARRLWENRTVEAQARG